MPTVNSQIAVPPEAPPIVPPIPDGWMEYPLSRDHSATPVYKKAPISSAIDSTMPTVNSQIAVPPEAPPYPPIDIMPTIPDGWMEHPLSCDHGSATPVYKKAPISSAIDSIMSTVNSQIAVPPEAPLIDIAD